YLFSPCSGQLRYLPRLLSLALISSPSVPALSHPNCCSGIKSRHFALHLASLLRPCSSRGRLDSLFSSYGVLFLQPGLIGLLPSLLFSTLILPTQCGRLRDPSIA